jgi:two-component system, cell cycle sensor histidine kinase and response regulator CckA
MVLRVILRREGFPVLEANTAEEALRLARTAAHPVRLLVTDVALPGMTGPELADRLSAERPGLRVLFISGYPYDALIQDGKLDPDAPFLQKPFAPSELGRKVRELLACQEPDPTPRG